ncbi:hypothetical protein D3C78_1153350 [compost metagenome]
MPALARLAGWARGLAGCLVLAALLVPAALALALPLPVAASALLARDLGAGWRKAVSPSARRYAVVRGK